MAKWWPGGRWWGGVWPQIDFLSNIFAGLLSSVLFFVFLYLLHPKINDIFLFYILFNQTFILIRK